MRVHRVVQLVVTMRVPYFVVANPIKTWLCLERRSSLLHLK
jgi:hypothetical protein